MPVGSCVGHSVDRVRRIGWGLSVICRQPDIRKILIADVGGAAADGLIGREADVRRIPLQGPNQAKSGYGADSIK